MTLSYSLNDVLAFGKNVRHALSKLYKMQEDLDTRLTRAEGTDLEDRLKIVAVNVSTGNANGSSAADATLVDGTIIGYFPVGNQDQITDNVELGSDGKVTVTLAANATAQNQFKVAVLKPLAT